jgi:hypothetical protein
MPPGRGLWSTRPLRRDSRATPRVRGIRSRSYSRVWTQCANVTASSSAWHQPWSRFGVVACAASPDNATRPRPCQRVGGRTISLCRTSSSRAPFRVSGTCAAHFRQGSTASALECAPPAHVRRKQPIQSALAAGPNAELRCPSREATNRPPHILCRAVCLASNNIRRHAAAARDSGRRELPERSCRRRSENPLQSARRFQGSPGGMEPGAACASPDAPAVARRAECAVEPLGARCCERRGHAP